jgi:hypothetical protein
MEKIEKILFYALWYTSSLVFVLSFFVEEAKEFREYAMVTSLIGMAIVRIIRLEEKNK